MFSFTRKYFKNTLIFRNSLYATFSISGNNNLIFNEITTDRLINDDAIVHYKQGEKDDAYYYDDNDSSEYYLYYQSNLYRDVMFNLDRFEKNSFLEHLTIKVKKDIEINQEMLKKFLIEYDENKIYSI